MRAGFRAAAGLSGLLLSGLVPALSVSGETAGAGAQDRAAVAPSTSDSARDDGAQGGIVDFGREGAAARPPLGHGDVTYTYAASAFVPSFEPPAPGTYELPPIDTVADHALVDAEGRATSLRELVGGRIAVVSFIYGTCNEAAGCPLSTAVLHGLDRALADAPEMTRDVALLTISFDPERDRPQRLATMQASRAPGSTWRFATAKDEEGLAPLLDDFGQTISKLYWPDGSWTGVYRHVLKVYLLDRRMQVRNVYSVGYLGTDVVRADIETLRMEEKRR